MPEESDSLKAEMSELLQADRERARERRPNVLLEGGLDPAPVDAEPPPEPQRGKGGRLRRLFGQPPRP